MALVVRGMLNKQIAAVLGASEKTIKIHRRRVMEKMQVPSVADLVRAAEKIGIRPGFTSQPAEWFTLFNSFHPPRIDIGPRSYIHPLILADKIVVKMLCLFLTEESFRQRLQIVFVSAEPPQSISTG